MCAELNLGPDWFKNSIFPKPEAWARTAMKSLDQNRINADVGGYPMHEILCAIQRNWGERIIIAIDLIISPSKKIIFQFSLFL